MCSRNRLAPGAITQQKTRNNSLVPPGMIAPFAIATPPAGWLECNGQAVSRTDYADLFAVMGTLYGAGNGSTTFNLPDYRGYFLRGWDHGAGRDRDAASRTDRGDGTGGDVVGSFQGHAFDSHNHSGSTNSAGSHSHNVSGGYHTDSQHQEDTQGVIYSPGYVDSQWRNGLINTTGSHTHSLSIGNSGGSETRPSNINVMYCIKY